MITNLGFNKKLFLITGVLALMTGLMGILNPKIYDSVVSARIMPGVYTQDLLVILAAIVIIILAIWMKEDDYRKLVIIFGVLGFFFYAYGIYAIEQIYTVLYPAYLLILGLSFFVLAYSLSCLKKSAVEELQLRPLIRFGAAGYGIFIAVMFNFIWISQLIPLIQTGERIEYTFSVYIIDLVFIMPAFVITSVMAVRKRAVGVIGLPALFILGVGILSPLALAEVIKPSRYAMPVNPGEFWLYGALSMAFLVISICYLIFLKPQKEF